MAFTRSLRKPDNSLWLRNPADLSRMSDDQFTEEKQFWESVHEVGGFFQIELGEFVLSNAIAPLQRLRELGTNPAAPRLDLEPLEFRQTLGTLALAHLVRKLFGFKKLAEGVAGRSVSARGVDIDLRGEQPVTFLHERVEGVRRLIPVYDSTDRGAWYEDETLILKALHPAKPTGGFRRDVPAVFGGEPFDASQYVTLRPHLKLAYVQS